MYKTDRDKRILNMRNAKWIKAYVEALYFDRELCLTHNRPVRNSVQQS